MRGSLLQITTFIEWTDTRAGKTEMPLQLGKESPIIMSTNIPPPPLDSVEATEVCIPVGNDVLLLAAVYRALERWEIKLANTDVSPEAIWPIAKSFMKRSGPKEPTAIHGPFGLTFHLLEKANAIADCLENQFKPHDPCYENHKRQVKARVQTLLEAVDNNSPESIRPCDLQKLVNSLKLRKACGIDGITNECLRQHSRRPLVHLTHEINHCLRLYHFPTLWKDAKIITLSKPERILNSHQNLRPISL
jgi:hypothetical protein